MNATTRPRDGHLRITPYELAFPDNDFAESRFHAVEQEAQTRDADIQDSGAFLLLAQVGRILQELGERASPSALVPTFGPFLFHAFHFHRAGKPAFLVETSTLRYLLEADAAPPGWRGEMPATAGYLQLPRHLIWARPEGQDGPAEAVDGLFWTGSSPGRLDLLVVTGIRGDRPGFSVLPVPPVSMEEAMKWMTRPAREKGDDFATTLPGGELDRLYSLETQGEVVKLAARILSHVSTGEGAMGPEEAGPGMSEAARKGGEPNGSAQDREKASSGNELDPASRMPFRRIRLGA